MTQPSAGRGPGALLPDFSESAPWPRIGAGILLVIVGALLTWGLWASGWYWGPVAVLVPLGIGLVLSGMGGLRTQRAVRREWRRARADRGALVEGLVAAKQRGEAPVDWLRRHGYRSPRVRRYLIGHVRRRMRD